MAFAVDPTLSCMICSKYLAVAHLHDPSCQFAERYAVLKHGNKIAQRTLCSLMDSLMVVFDVFAVSGSDVSYIVAVQQ